MARSMTHQSTSTYAKNMEAMMIPDDRMTLTRLALLVAVGVWMWLVLVGLGVWIVR